MSESWTSKVVDLSTATRFDHRRSSPTDEVRDRELRRLYDPVLSEPVPSNFMDIIQRLSQKHGG